MSALSRRAFLLTGSVLVVGCGPRRAETPLAHLYGKEWVRGAYRHYAQAYADVESRARASTFEGYGLLAQKGVTALDQLQRREVPFYVRVAADGRSFRVERDVPERLTFSAEMSAAEREVATANWKLAREHLHTDYEEVRRLDFALSGLLAQLGRVRFAIDEGLLEQYRLCRQLQTLDGGGELPFELPYQVTRAEYLDVLLLLLDRIERERRRLERAEAAIVAVGLATRATDAGSASLAANVRKVLLAVLRDSEAETPVSVAYPEPNDERAAALARAREISRRIGASPEYSRWLAVQQEREDVVGQLLTTLDGVLGLPVSGVYRQVMRMWRGGGDYLDYLKLAAAIVPGGTGISATLNDAIETTDRYRSVLANGRDVIGRLDESTERFELGGAALVNVGTRRARAQLGRQLAFYRAASEADEVAEALRSSRFGTAPLADVPGAQ